MAPECVFCDIIDGKIKAPLLHEDDDVIAFADARPIAPRHVLVVPRKHHATLTDASGSVGNAALLGKLLKVAAEIGARQAEQDGGYRIVINTGPSAGQTVYHLHIHVMSGRHFAWPPG